MRDPARICFYGRDLARATVNIGEAVGVIAAQSSVSPAAQLTMRRSASAASVRSHRAVVARARNEGTVKKLNSSSWWKDRWVVMNRQGELVLSTTSAASASATAAVRRRLMVQGQPRHPSRRASCSPSGIRRDADRHRGLRLREYGDIIDGVTMRLLDEITGLSRKTIIESKDADSRPRITLKDADGKPSSSPAG